MLDIYYNKSSIIQYTFFNQHLEQYITLLKSSLNKNCSLNFVSSKNGLSNGTANAKTLNPFLFDINISYLVCCALYI